MLFNVRFLSLLLILFIKPLIALSLQNIISDDETINSYKVYIDTGVAWGGNHEQLEGEEKKYFIESIFRWMDYFSPNELGNLHANLEKITLYAKLLLDRKSDLITHNIITNDELKQHNLSCQESFKNIFEFEKAGQITIDLSDAHRLCNALSFELPTPLQPILNFVLPFHSPLVSVIPSTPLISDRVGLPVSSIEKMNSISAFSISSRCSFVKSIP